MTDKRDIQDASTPGATLGDLLLLLKRNIELDLRVAAPATVATYDPALQKADLLLGPMPVQTTPEGVDVPAGEVKLWQVPVSWPRTNLGFIMFPLAPGDTGTVIFSDRSLTTWLQAGVPIDPVQGRAHNLADGIFVPGLKADTNPVVAPGHVASIATVIDGPLIHLGAGATIERAVKGTTRMTSELAMLSGISAAATTLGNTATSLGGAPVPGTDIATFATALVGAITGFSAAYEATLSTKVMVE
jgi:hypothetical protein